MAQLTAHEILTKVKRALGETTPYNDEALNDYIEIVQSEMIEGGVPETVVTSSKAVGCIAVGVNDYWFGQAGGTKHSPAFDKSLIQLSLARGED